jgi:hypothetical protein
MLFKDGRPSGKHEIFYEASPLYVPLVVCVQVCLRRTSTRSWSLWSRSTKLQGGLKDGSPSGEHEISSIGGLCAGLSEENIDTILEFVERYVPIKLYRHVFCPPSTDDEDADLALQEKIRGLHWINPYILDAQLALGSDNPRVQAAVDKAIEGTCQPQSLPELLEHTCLDSTPALIPYLP